MTEKRAIILAGGKGTRLRPYTVALPKPLMPVGDYPILEIIVRQLARAGFKRITMAVNHQADLIRAFFADGEKWGLSIDYSLETEPLGTMGPLNLIPDLPCNFLVMNGDILTDLDFAGFFDEHVAQSELFSVSSYLREQIVDYGVLDTDAADKVTGFREKPHNQYLVSMGIYMMSREVLGFVPRDNAYGFDDLMHALINAEEDVSVKRFGGYWLDIGRPEDYARAVDEFAAMRDRFIDD